MLLAHIRSYLRKYLPLMSIAFFFTTPSPLCNCRPLLLRMCTASVSDATTTEGLQDVVHTSLVFPVYGVLLSQSVLISNPGVQHARSVGLLQLSVRGASSGLHDGCAGAAATRLRRNVMGTRPVKSKNDLIMKVCCS